MADGGQRTASRQARLWRGYLGDSKAKAMDQPGTPGGLTVGKSACSFILANNHVP